MHALSILVLEDDQRLLEELSEYLRAEGFNVFEAKSPGEAMTKVSNNTIDIAIIDIKLPEYDGIEFLKKIKQRNPEIEAIMMSGHGDMESVIAAMREGAFDYLRKPFTPLDMQIAIERTKKYIEAQDSARELKTLCDTLQQEITTIGDFSLIGKSQALHTIAQVMDAASKHPESPVLITGESGTGKELIARLIHLKSERKNARFLPVNCAAIPKHLFESEFFGHKKGAFTDARNQRNGFFKSANGGTLFLDEIGDMSYEAQAKLLRIIEDEAVKPVGADEEFPVDVRIICATNQPVEELIEQKKFRLDFYHRISVLEIYIPPLRERPEDIPLLAAYFLKSLGEKMGKKNLQLHPGSLETISAYPFPGNVRELKNIIEKAIIMGDNPVVLTPPASHKKTVRNNGGDSSPDNSKDMKTLNLEALEKDAVSRALAISEGNITKAAALLGISRQALDRRIIKYGIQI
jgi:DNA-binding NtrC family response regulator